MIENINTIEVSDALIYLKSLADNSVNCVITSPPYWGLRDYGVGGQMGLEPTLKDFIQGQVELFREVRRVLRNDGTLWINMGDAYGSSVNGRSAKDTKAAGKDNRSFVDKPFSTVGNGIKEKDVVGQPWRLAFALQDDGWHFRQDIIWSKLNPMPESAKDRFTKSHEYVFLFTKKPNYWFDWFAVREPAVGEDNRPPAGSDGTLGQPNRRKLNRGNAKTFRHGGRFVASKSFANNATIVRPPSTQNGVPNRLRNRRSVWNIPIQPSLIKHHATFPEALIEPMIKAGCPKLVCAQCKTPYVRLVLTEGGRNDDYNTEGTSDFIKLTTGKSNSQKMPENHTYIDHGLHAQCECEAETQPGVVLDIFMGSGTTALVARNLGRNFIGCDLNPTYVAAARDRLRQPFELKQLKKETRLDDLPLFNAGQ